MNDNILLIYELVPDAVKIYFFENPDTELHDKLIRCNGQICNATTSDDNLMTWLCEFLETQTTIYETEKKQNLCLIKPCKMVVSGFLL